MVLDPPTKHLFLTDPWYGAVYMIDPATEKMISKLIVPGAFGIDETSDHSTLYVGTQIGDIYAIDPVTFSITKRWIAGEIGPYGFETTSARVLKDGRLALLGVQGGIPSVDGSSEIAIWNPADNSITIYGGYGTGGGIPSPCGVINIGLFTLNADRSKVIVGSIDSDHTLCEIDVASGSAITTQPAVPWLWHVSVSPDGTSLILPSTNSSSDQAEALVLDPNTLEQIDEFPIAGDSSSAASFFISPDSKTLYTASPAAIYAYDIASHAQTGWMPNIVVEDTSGGLAVGSITGPILQVMDSTGLLMGPMEEGVGFLDTTQMQTGSVGTLFANAYLNPTFGPVTGGTAVLWSSVTSPSLVSKIYFGGNIASSISSGSGGVDVMSPAGAAGPADFYGLTNDGGMQIVPEGFSFGPTALQTTTNFASEDGGGSAYIFGYGFGPYGSASSIPSDLSVTVGSSSAAITEYVPNAYGLDSPPMPLEAAGIAIPPGSVTSDVTVKNSTGSWALSQAMSYIPKPATYAAHGAELAQGVYDSVRDVYYFTDASSIRVFSRTDSAWMSSIPITGIKPTAERLWGLSLSPDGSKLAIADIGAGAIYLLNPDTPASITSFAVPLSLNYGTATLPAGVAVSNAGIVYFAAITPGVSGADSYFSLNTNTGAWTNYGVGNDGNDQDVYSRLALSNDGARAYFNEDGVTFAIDTASGTVTYAPAPLGTVSSYDITLSANQTSLASDQYFYDADFNPESFLSENDREILTAVYVYGAKLSPDGTLFFQPGPNGIDVFDAHRGELMDRVALNITLSPNYDALVSDGHDNVLLAITGTNGDGIAVIDLSTVSEPTPVTYSAKRRHELRSAPRRPRHKDTTPGSHSSPASSVSTSLPPRKTFRFETSSALLPGSFRLRMWTPHKALATP
jgi:hypothetical protein